MSQTIFSEEDTKNRHIPPFPPPQARRGGGGGGGGGEGGGKSGVGFGFTRSQISR